MRIEVGVQRSHLDKAVSAVMRVDSDRGVDRKFTALTPLKSLKINTKISVVAKSVLPDYKRG